MTLPENAQAAAPTSAGRAFVQGVQDQVPILLGVIPFGLIFGALAVSQGISGWATQGLSILVFAGSAQFVAAELAGSGAPALLIVFTILVVNLRHMLYSASLAPHFRRLPLRWRAVLAWLLTDEAFATTSSRVSRGNTHQLHWYLLGTGLALWACWQISTAVGNLAWGRGSLQLVAGFRAAPDVHGSDRPQPDRPPGFGGRRRRGTWPPWPWPACPTIWGWCWPA